MPLFFCAASLCKKIHPAKGAGARPPLWNPRAPWLRPGPGSRRGVGGALSPTEWRGARCFRFYQRSIQGPAQGTIGAPVVIAEELRLICSRRVMRRNFNLPAHMGRAEELWFARSHGEGGETLIWPLLITPADVGTSTCLLLWWLRRALLCQLLWEWRGALVCLLL